MAVTIRRLFYRGTGGSGGATDAINVEYDNSTSGLSANNVQDAIDELAAGTGVDGQGFSFTNPSWVGPTGDNTYSFTIPFASHSKQNPTISVFELISGTYVEVETIVTINGSFDVIIEVPSTPDLRFIGKIIIS